MIVESEGEDEVDFGTQEVCVMMKNHVHDASRYPTVGYCAEWCDIMLGREHAITFKKPGFSPHTRNVFSEVEGSMSDLQGQHTWAILDVSL